MSGERKFEQDGIQDVRLLRLLTEIRDSQERVEERVAVMEKNLTMHIDEAFPGGDSAGHRRYHETQIEMLEERRKLRVAVQEKTISGLVWSGIVAVGMAVWHYWFGR